MVGDKLETVAARGGVGDDPCHHLGVFARGDLERVEQAALAIVELLNADAEATYSWLRRGLSCYIQPEAIPQMSTEKGVLV